MSKYTGNKVTLKGTPEQLAARFADMTVFANALEQMPEDERAKLGDVRFTTDSMIMVNPQVGDIVFSVKERTPNRVAFDATGPLPMSLVLNLTPNGEEATDMVPEMEVDVPLFLRPMVGPLLTKSLDHVGNFMGVLSQK